MIVGVLLGRGSLDVEGASEPIDGLGEVGTREGDSQEESSC